MDEWVLRAACARLHVDQPAVDRGQPFADQLPARDISSTILSILIETGLDPKRLEIEITEGVLIADFSRAVSLLGKIKALGVRIAMDDFARAIRRCRTCSRSHSTRSNRSDLRRQPRQQAALAAIIPGHCRLGRALGLPVIGRASRPRRSAASSSRKDRRASGLPDRAAYPIQHYRDVVFGARPVAIAS